MENLFFPIFSGLQQRKIYQVSIYQFSWADKTEVSRISRLAKAQGLAYIHAPITRNRPAALESFKAILSNRASLLSYVKSQNIQTVIARSTMPALLSLLVLKQLKSLGCEVIFDADGLPIQERLDSRNLRKGSVLHQVLVGIEQRILVQSDKILVRTQQSIAWHQAQIASLSRDKFYQVGNGRDPGKFFFDPAKREVMRSSLGVDKELILIHTGSVGPGYALDVLFNLLLNLHQQQLDFQMIFLARDSAYLKELIPPPIFSKVKVLQVDFEEVPDYLMAADVGIGLRLVSAGAKGLLPIKVGEYMMCGLPMLLSKGVGDLDLILDGKGGSFFIENRSPDWSALVDWLKGVDKLDRKELSQLGKALFSLESTLDQYEKALK